MRSSSVRFGWVYVWELTQGSTFLSRSSYPFASRRLTMTQSKSRLILICILLAQIVGCRGCNEDTAKGKGENADEIKKKIPLVSDDLRTLPYSSDIPGIVVKPGHWYQARNKLTANLSDEGLTASLKVLDRNRKVPPFLTGSLPIEFHRNVNLVKGQEKTIDLKYFQPEVTVPEKDLTFDSRPTATLVSSYARRGLGTPLHEPEYPIRMMDGYQYNLVVLSRDMSRYTFWRGLDCIIWPSRMRLTEDRLTPHRIVDIGEEEMASHFPNRLYAMTNISHIVLNDTSVQLMALEQQTALVDWLHFGGTVIINGPDAIAGLDSSVLRSYVPIKSVETETMSATQIDLLNEHWTIERADDNRRDFEAPKPIPVLRGELLAGAAWVTHLDGLVAERLVGQGRVVMTMFPMSAPEFVRWPSYSSFVHNAILRKPFRSPTTGIEADMNYGGVYHGQETNPLYSTRFRIWARDLDSQLLRREELSPNSMRTQDEIGATVVDKKGSVGAWNPNSTISAYAAVSLRDASGISVPRIKTIIQLLIGYLIVLVPLNWVIFRLFGRPEFAWLAAPIIALVGAVVVARSVQLDVGFSRSESTYGFLEMHNRYPRGVLTSYRALYTSLSTNYGSTYDEEAGVVTPVVTTGEGSRRRSLLDKLDYWYADSRGSGILNLPILSNTTGMLHSEETVAFQGAVNATLSDDESSLTLTSDLGLELRDVAVIGRTKRGKYVAGWIGDPGKGIPVQCSLETRASDQMWMSQWDNHPSLAEPRSVGEDGQLKLKSPLADGLYLGPMLSALTKSYPLTHGEFIAIGWADSNLSQLKVTPVAKQQKARTVILFHVTPPPLANARADTSLFAKETMIEESADEVSEEGNPTAIPPKNIGPMNSRRLKPPSGN